MLRRGLRLALQRLDASCRATAVCSSSLFRTSSSIPTLLRASECLTGVCSSALPPIACAWHPADAACCSPEQVGAASGRHRSAARSLDAESCPARRHADATVFQGYAPPLAARSPAREPRRSLSGLPGFGGLQGGEHGYTGLKQAGSMFSTALIRPPHLQQRRPRCAQAQLQPIPYTVDVFTGGPPDLLSCPRGPAFQPQPFSALSHFAYMHCAPVTLPARSIPVPGASGL